MYAKPTLSQTWHVNVSGLITHRRVITMVTILPQSKTFKTRVVISVLWNSPSCGHEADQVDGAGEQTHEQCRLLEERVFARGGTRTRHLRLAYAMLWQYFKSFSLIRNIQVEYDLLHENRE